MAQYGIHRNEMGQLMEALILQEDPQKGTITLRGWNGDVPRELVVPQDEVFLQATQREPDEIATLTDISGDDYTVRVLRGDRTGATRVQNLFYNAPIISVPTEQLSNFRIEE